MNLHYTLNPVCQCHSLCVNFDKAVHLRL